MRIWDNWHLLITLFLCESGCLSQPLLYLSGFFDETRDDYYRLLLNVSQKGAWREWIEYFLRGVRLQAQRALKDTQHIIQAYENYQVTLKSGKRVPQEAARVLERIFANPVIAISRYAERMGISYHLTLKWRSVPRPKQASATQKRKQACALHIFL